jgi:hypothetical protein
MKLILRTVILSSAVALIGCSDPEPAAKTETPAAAPVAEAAPEPEFRSVERGTLSDSLAAEPESPLSKAERERNALLERQAEALEDRARFEAARAAVMAEQNRILAEQNELLRQRAYQEEQQQAEAERRHNEAMWAAEQRAAQEARARADYEQYLRDSAQSRQVIVVQPRRGRPGGPYNPQNPQNPHQPNQPGTPERPPHTPTTPVVTPPPALPPTPSLPPYTPELPPTQPLPPVQKVRPRQTVDDSRKVPRGSDDVSLREN